MTIATKLSEARKLIVKSSHMTDATNHVGDWDYASWKIEAFKRAEQLARDSAE